MTTALQTAAEHAARLPIGHWSIWVMYGIGNVLHVLLKANVSIKSKTNAVENLKAYLAYRWIPILCRAFLNVCVFVFVWDNPALVDIDRFMTTGATQLAVSGILGWFTDSVFDKIIGMLSQAVPGLQKELPVVPEGGESGAAQAKTGD